MADSAMKITEKYEFKTDILTSYDGTEQRLKLRQYPRHYLTYDYSAMDLYQAQYLRGCMRMRQTDMWYVPMWHSPAYLAENFVADGMALKVDPKYLYGFDECEYLTIHIVDDATDSLGKNITRAINRYTETEIELQTRIKKRLLIENTFIYPLRRCIIQPSLGSTYGWSNGTEVALAFEDLNVKSKIHLPYSIRYEYENISEQYNRWKLPTVFNGKEVFFVEPKWIEDNDNQLTVGKNTFRMDNETGIFMYDLKNNHSYDTHSYEMLFETRPKISNLIKFFKRMCGRYKTFYMPTWGNDFQVTRDIVAGQHAIYTDFKRLYKFYNGNGTKKYIVIFTKDWKSYIYQIMSYSYETVINAGSSVKYGKLLLQETITKSLRVDDILMCSYFNLVRFDEDELTIDYESNIVARVNIAVKEVDM
jgi:hypothetical protein